MRPSCGIIKEEEVIIPFAGLGLFVALPLSLLRNIESLQIVCTTSILFYLLVVFRYQNTYVVF
jgi:hypothetical protein